MDCRNCTNSSKSRGHISVTPQMILLAIKRLQLRKVYVPSSLIAEYLRYSYPVDSDQKTFTEELKQKLNCAVIVGLILRHGEDSYYLPTLRQKANALETSFAEFWETYQNYRRVIASQTKNQNKTRSISRRRTRNKKYTK